MNPSVENLRDIQLRYPNLFPYFIEFIFNPAAYLHPSRRFELLPEIPEKIWNIPRVQGRISNLLIQKIQMNVNGIWEVSHCKWALALLPTSRLNRLARHIGAIITASEIRSSLSRENVLEWKQRLGSDAYAFAMNSASLLPRIIISQEISATNYPESIGYSFIYKSIEDFPKDMKERFLLKIPSNCAAALTEINKANLGVQAVFEILEREWYSLFETSSQ